MDIRVQSVKFDADVKLLEFIQKKVGKLEKFYDSIIKAEVALLTLSLFRSFTENRPCR